MPSMAVTIRLARSQWWVMRSMLPLRSEVSSSISSRFSGERSCAIVSVSRPVIVAEDSAKFLTNWRGLRISWATLADSSPSSASFCWLTMLSWAIRSSSRVLSSSWFFSWLDSSLT